MSETISNLGTIVNDKEGQIKELTIDEAVIPIRVPDAMFDRFVKAAQFHGHRSVEDWATAVLISSLTTKIGAPSISSPGQLSGQDARKVTGPSNLGMVSRA